MAEIDGQTKAFAVGVSICLFHFSVENGAVRTKTGWILDVKPFWKTVSRKARHKVPRLARHPPQRTQMRGSLGAPAVASFARDDRRARFKFHVPRLRRVALAAAGRRYVACACSTAWARRMMVGSPKCLPRICSPIGSFTPAVALPLVVAHGTEMPGMPARSAVTV